MSAYSLDHLSDEAVLHDLDSAAARERTSTAWVLAHIGEADARRLYLPAGFSSMHAYCVERLHFCEHAAYKRIQAAGHPPQVGPARRFPVIFAAVAAGRLHLTGVVLLAPHLAPENADALIGGRHLQNQRPDPAALGGALPALRNAGAGGGAAGSAVPAERATGSSTSAARGVH
jgi:hypothetical protein